MQDRTPLTPKQAKEGVKIVVDDGFLCINEGEIRTLKIADGRLYFDCEGGMHDIESQISDDDKYYIGLYLKD